VLNRPVPTFCRSTLFSSLFVPLVVRSTVIVLVSAFSVVAFATVIAPVWLMLPLDCAVRLL